MNELLAKATEYTNIIVFCILGLIGGIVRVFSDPKIYGVKRITGTILMAGFSGGLASAILHEIVKDPTYLGAISAIAGYMGQVALVLISKFIQNKVKLNISINVDKTKEEK